MDFDPRFDAKKEAIIEALTQGATSFLGGYAS